MINFIHMIKKNRISKYVGLLLMIIIIAFLFPFTIHIQDALSLQTSPEFGIHISLWRILFEPLLGLILFFNRGIFSLEENLFILYWILIIFIVYTIIKSIITKNKKDRKKLISSQLINLPLIISLWFTFFVITIFLSRFLPSNTIVNNSTNSILVTTHSHSEVSHDGLISQDNLWKWHKENNFDAFFVTDHANHEKSFDFARKQRRGEFSIDPLVMVGEEYSASNHMSLLGLKNRFKTKKMSDQAVVDSVHAYGGVVIINHWFDKQNNTLEYYRNLGVDGFEIENTALEKSYDRKLYQKIKHFCEKNNLIMNGGLDFHGYGNVCSIWNAMEIPEWHKLNPTAKEEAILNIIKSRDQSKFKVLLYVDRPYYTHNYLLFKPIISVFSYFRTLNIFQVLSWIFWVLFIFFLKRKISSTQVLSNYLSTYRMTPLIGVFSAILMLVLAIVFYIKKDKLVYTENDVFAEYSEIFFYVGSILLIYAGLVSYFRIFKNKTL